MKYVRLVDSIDFINKNDLTENIKVKDFEESDVSDFLQYSNIELDIDANDEDIEIIVHRYTCKEPDFVILKILKPIGYKRMVFKDKNGEEIYWLTVIQKDTDRDLIESTCLFRLFDTKEEGEINFEELMHNAAISAHKSDVENKFSSNSLVSKSFTDCIYAEDNTSIVNSNILTKDFQIFNFGNLIQSNEELT